MKEHIAQLEREMEDARLTVEWCKRERVDLLNRQLIAQCDYRLIEAKLKALKDAK
jgi:hypothetical protein